MSLMINKIIVNKEQNLDDEYKKIARENIDAISINDTSELVNNGISDAFTVHEIDEDCHKDIRDTIDDNYSTLSGFITQEVNNRISSNESIMKEISEMDVQSDWDVIDETSKSFIMNKPIPITESEIDGMFV